VARDADGARVHFVGHSLGNILVRWVLTHQPPERTGRVVMLAPPNQGSAAADRFTPWVGWFLRPISELRTREGSTVRTLAPLRGVEVGIIAGEFDGKVSTAEAQLPGARDFRVVPAAHTFIMDRRDARALTTRFLRTGRFDGAETPRPAAP
jgi:pimeloyl-ACP methyl ester carboxylesterase